MATVELNCETKISKYSDSSPFHNYLLYLDNETIATLFLRIDQDNSFPATLDSQEEEKCAASSNEMSIEALRGCRHHRLHVKLRRAGSSACEILSC